MLNAATVVKNTSNGSSHLNSLGKKSVVTSHVEGTEKQEALHCYHP